METRPCALVPFPRCPASRGPEGGSRQEPAGNAGMGVEGWPLRRLGSLEVWVTVCWTRVLGRPPGLPAGPPQVSPGEVASALWQDTARPPRLRAWAWRAAPAPPLSGSPCAQQGSLRDNRHFWLIRSLPFLPPPPPRPSHPTPRRAFAALPTVTSVPLHVPRLFYVSTFASGFPPALCPSCPRPRVPSYKGRCREPDPATQRPLRSQPLARA